MRDEFSRLNNEWSKLGYDLGFGIGIAAGFATMGIVGFEGRFDYTANATPSMSRHACVTTPLMDKY